MCKFEEKNLISVVLNQRLGRFTEIDKNIWLLVTKFPEVEYSLKII